MTSGFTFRLLRIPIRLQVWFFAILILINLQRLTPFARAPVAATVDFAIGMAAAAVVLIGHELGHCFAYRRFGQEPSVYMSGLLNHTYGSAPLPAARKLLVALAGNAVTLLAIGVPAFVLAAYVFTSPSGVSLLAAPDNLVAALFTYTVLWSLLNVLPILPLDGGHVVEAVLEMVHGEPQKQTARLVSGVAGIGFGFLALVLLFQPFLMLILVVLGVLNLIPWNQERNGQPVRTYLPDDDVPMGIGGGLGGGGREANIVSMDKARRKRERRSPAELVKDGYEALERREYKAALRISERLTGKRLNAELDRWTAEMAAFAWIGDRNPSKAAEVIAQLPRGARTSTPLAAVLAVANKRTEEGMTLMVKCMVNEPEGGPKLIAVDLFAEFGMIHRLARDLVDQPGGAGFEAAVSLEGMLHRLHRTQDATTVSDVILLG
jgi:Zn-dependent protease